MPKIMVIGSHPDSLVNFRYDMLRAMAQKHAVIACAPDASTPVVTALRDINVQYRNINMARTKLNPLGDLKTLLSIYSVCKDERPDLILSYTSKAVIYGSLAAKLAGVAERYAMITGLGSYFIHNDPKSRLVCCIMGVLYKIALLFNTKVFFQNPDDVADFARLRIFKDPKRTVFINGSGVNIAHFSPLPYPPAPSFLMIARLIKAKGLLEYLAAARMLKRQYPEVRCLLVGWFEEKQESVPEEILDEYINDHSIEYLGKLEDVRPALQQASVYVLPSYREGTPKSVLEAMACARAIITTDVPGCRETVQDNGILVPVRDAQGLYLAMQRFVLQPELIKRMGNNSRVIAEARFAVDKVNQVILTSMGLA